MGEVILMGTIDASFVLSLIGALSGIAGFGGFLFTLLSERANVLLSDFSERSEVYNAFFKNRFKGWMTKYNAFARVRISNNSKLPICIIDAKFQYKGIEYRASIRKADHSCSFIIGEYDGLDIKSDIDVAKDQIMFPMEIGPFGFVEGILFFHIFPDVPASEDITIPIEFVTNRKKSYFLNMKFITESHLNQIRFSGWKESKERIK